MQGGGFSPADPSPLDPEEEWLREMRTTIELGYDDVSRLMKACLEIQTHLESNFDVDLSLWEVSLGMLQTFLKERVIDRSVVLATGYQTPAKLLPTQRLMYTPHPNCVCAILNLLYHLLMRAQPRGIRELRNILQFCLSPFLASECPQVVYRAVKLFVLSARTMPSFLLGGSYGNDSQRLHIKYLRSFSYGFGTDSLIPAATNREVGEDMLHKLCSSRFEYYLHTYADDDSESQEKRMREYIQARREQFLARAQAQAHQPSPTTPNPNSESIEIVPIRRSRALRRAVDRSRRRRQASYDLEGGGGIEENLGSLGLSSDDDDDDEVMLVEDTDEDSVFDEENFLPSPSPSSEESRTKPTTNLEDLGSPPKDRLPDGDGEILVLDMDDDDAEMDVSDEDLISARFGGGGEEDDEEEGEGEVVVVGRDPGKEPILPAQEAKRVIEFADLHTLPSKSRRDAFQFYWDITKSHWKSMKSVHQVDLWTRVRLCFNFGQEAHRLTFVKIRMIAIAALSFLHSINPSETTEFLDVFRQTPNLVEQMLELLKHPQVSIVTREWILDCLCSLLMNPSKQDQVILLMLPEGAQLAASFVATALKACESKEELARRIPRNLFEVLLSLGTHPTGARRMADTGILAELLSLLKTRRGMGTELVVQILNVLAVVSPADCADTLLRLGVVQEMVRTIVWVLDLNKDIPPLEIKPQYRRMLGYALLVTDGAVRAGSGRTNVRDVLQLGLLESVSTIMKNVLGFSPQVVKYVMRVMTLLLTNEPACVNMCLDDFLEPVIQAVLEESFAPDPGVLGSILPVFLVFSRSNNPRGKERLEETSAFSKILAWTCSPKYWKLFSSGRIPRTFFRTMSDFLNQSDAEKQALLRLVVSTFEKFTKHLSEAREISEARGKETPWMKLSRSFCYHLATLSLECEPFCQMFVTEGHMNTLFQFIRACPVLAVASRRGGGGMDIDENPPTHFLTSIAKYLPAEVVKMVVTECVGELRRHETMEVTPAPEARRHIFTIFSFVRAFQSIFARTNYFMNVRSWTESGLIDAVMLLTGLEKRMKIAMVNIQVDLAVAKRVKLLEERERMKAEAEAREAAEAAEADGLDEEEGEVDVEPSETDGDVTMLDAAGAADAPAADAPDGSETDETDDVPMPDAGDAAKDEEEQERDDARLKAHQFNLYKLLCRSCATVVNSFLDSVQLLVFKLLRSGEGATRDFQIGSYFKELLVEVIMIRLGLLEEINKGEERPSLAARALMVRWTVEDIHVLLFSKQHRNTNTFLIHRLQEKQGLTRFLTLAKQYSFEFLDYIGSSGGVRAVTEGKLDPACEVEVHACADGCVCLFRFIQKLSSLTYVVESPMTRSLLMIDTNFSPSKFVKTVQINVAPLLIELWRHPSLTTSGAMVASLFTNIVAHVVRGTDDEESGFKGPDKPEIEVDEMAMMQLAAMGFPLYKCKVALQRYQNNVRMATEWLLQYPNIPPPKDESTSEDDEAAMLEQAMLLSLTSNESVTTLRTEGIDWILEMIHKVPYVFSIPASDVLMTLFDKCKDDKPGFVKKVVVELDRLSKDLDANFKPFFDLLTSVRAMSETSGDFRDCLFPEEAVSTSYVDTLLDVLTELEKRASSETGPTPRSLVVMREGILSLSCVISPRLKSSDEFKMEDLSNFRRRYLSREQELRIFDMCQNLIRFHQVSELDDSASESSLGSQTTDEDGDAVMKTDDEPESEGEVSEVSEVPAEAASSAEAELNPEAELSRTEAGEKWEMPDSLLARILDLMDALISDERIRAKAEEDGLGSLLLRLPYHWRHTSLTLMVERLLSQLVLTPSVLGGFLRNVIIKTLPLAERSFGTVTGKALLHVLNPYVVRHPTALFEALKAVTMIPHGASSICLKPLEQLGGFHHAELSPAKKALLTDLMVLILEYEEGLFSFDRFDLLHFLGAILFCEEDVDFVLSFDDHEEFRASEDVVAPKSFLEFVIRRLLPHTTRPKPPNTAATKTRMTEFCCHQIAIHLLSVFACFRLDTVLIGCADVLFAIAEKKVRQPNRTMHGVGLFLDRLNLMRVVRQDIPRLVARRMVAAKHVSALTTALEALDLDHPDTPVISHVILKIVALLTKRLEGVEPTGEDPLVLYPLGYSHDKNWNEWVQMPRDSPGIASDGFVPMFAEDEGALYDDAAAIGAFESEDVETDISEDEDLDLDEAPGEFEEDEEEMDEDDLMDEVIGGEF